MKTKALIAFTLLFSGMFMAIGFWPVHTPESEEIIRNEVKDVGEDALSVPQSVREPDFLSGSDKWADSVLKTLNLRQQIAQFFMVAAYSSGDKMNTVQIEQWIKTEGIGGIIFFQGNRAAQKDQTMHYQSLTNVPLLVGMDAEWGPAMRLSDVERYPYQLTMGATQNEELVKQAGYWIGRECAELGVHLNFAPVVDVNVNPKNPVIGYRAFGENPREVAKLAVAFSSGMEEAGVMACVKHFPGHGDTDKDSHEELPTVNHTLTQFQAVDFVPFERTIRNGVSAVMVAHLNVPALDNSGTPSSLSKKVIKNWLQDTLGFKGLVVSDALNMKGVADHFGKEEVVVKAFLAGNDILLFPESVGGAIDGILQAVREGRVTESEIRERCKKVLMAKHAAAKKLKKVKELTVSDLAKIELTKRKIIEEAVTVVKDDKQLLPLRNLEKKTAVVVFGESEMAVNRLDDYAKFELFQFNTGMEPLAVLNKLAGYERVLTLLVASTNRPVKGNGLPDGWELYLQNFPAGKEHVVVHLGNPYIWNEKINLSQVNTLVLGYENSAYTQDLVVQMLFGARGASGRLPVTLRPDLKREKSIRTGTLDRLRFTIPEEIGVPRSRFDEIDSIAMKGIRQGAFPGCQIVVAKNGLVVYRKNFGKLTYEGIDQVTDRTVYDLASVTKIAGSTLSLMRLDGEGKFAVDSTLNSYLPDLVAGTAYARLKIKSLLTHSAGLTPWIPFYTKTMAGGKWNEEIYSTVPKTGYTKKVAENLYILDSYEDSMMRKILNTPIQPNQGYKYSDVGYYFMKEIIRRLTGQTLDAYVKQTFFEPMGLSTMRYNPLNEMPVSRIAPTEKDMIFRKQQIQGTVHDQGAAMTGGVGGHAGLFSNAIDLAALMQMMLNKGTYGGVRYLKADVVEKYTACPNCASNRRGLGFDKPTRSLSGGPTCELVSLSSYGHTGFTGTMVWADPNNGVNYVFLSNRVYTDAENKKILSLGTRIEIQRVIYQALQGAKTN
jgi:beta-N-acetylhexosaminidase